MQHTTHIPNRLKEIVAGLLLFLMAANYAEVQTSSNANSNIAANTAPIIRKGIHTPVQSKQAMVVTQHNLASEIGRAILLRGGNAVDAAVAVGVSLAVVLPRAGNIGGGGFMLIYMAEDDEVSTIDYRETAPAKATDQMFLNELGEPDPNLSRFHPKGVGVPGTVAGLYAAHRRFGELPWEELFEPAIRLANQGFPVTWDLAKDLQRGRHLMRSPYAQSIFRNSDGTPLKPGDVLIQRDLGLTLEDIAKRGPKAFYEGHFAQELASFMAANGGLITAEDMAGYEVVWRKPVSGTYRDIEIVSMPPPSSGGIHLIQMLKILETLDIANYGWSSANHIHRVTESMRFAFAERTKFLGDPAFSDIPVKWLLNQDRLTAAANQMDSWRALPVDSYGSDKPNSDESFETTHYSIVDAKGNAVSNTYTLNFSFGSGLMVPGTGVILNNELDDFVAKANVPNAYGLVNNERNLPAAKKRPLSSMTPTLGFKDGNLWLVTGSPGGPRIITAILHQILNLTDFNMNLAEATVAPRFHHQWKPEILFYEKGFSPDTLRILRNRGHSMREVISLGSLSSIVIEDDSLQGIADPRRPDGSVAGY